MAEVKHISNSLEDTKKIAIEFSKCLKEGSVVAFFATLGAGKTTFINNLINSFSKEDIVVTSPTFVYLNIYNLHLPIYHFDLYRIRNERNFEAMGFNEYFTLNGITLIEWAENIQNILPENTIFININHIDENKREIIIDQKKEMLLNC